MIFRIFKESTQGSVVYAHDHGKDGVRVPYPTIEISSLEDLINKSKEWGYPVVVYPPNSKRVGGHRKVKVDDVPYDGSILVQDMYLRH